MSEELYALQIEGLLQRVRRGWAPPPDLTVSEFSDKEIIVTSGPLAGTHWRTDFAPYQRGIMDVFHEPGITHAVVMGSSQWGKTACAVNVVAYHIAHDPCPILVVFPSIDPMAKDFAKNRLDTVINASPALTEVVSKKRAKDSSNTILMKTYRGGALAVGGANSAASLASRSVRLLVGDEIDRWPEELKGEGSTLAIAMKRTQSYQRRKRILLVSSPTVLDAPIHAWFKLGDQRRYYVPCPKCGHMHPYEWKHVKWADDDPRTARIHCPECDYGIDDAERVAILQRGEWRAEHIVGADASIASFHLWEAYSPLSSLREIVAAFLRALKLQRAGDKSEMHTWQNTTLGEPVDPVDGEQIKTHTLIERREPYPSDVPQTAVCLTAGVDTQDDRLEVLVIGWGVGEECWLVDRHTIPGNTEQVEPWAELEELILHRRYTHASGVELGIQSTCIDSAGHRTHLVYDFAAKHAARRVHAIIGRDGDRPIVSSPSPKRWGKKQRKVPLYTIGIEAAKTLWMDRLRLERPEVATSSIPGYVHIPVADWADDELAAQLTSEKIVKRWKKGVPVREWVKTRPRNEMLDCAVYGLAALRLLNPKLQSMANNIAALAERVRATMAPPPVPVAPTQTPAAAHQPPPATPVAAAPLPPPKPPTRPAGRRIARAGYLLR